jgi:hypothetical protein
MKDRRFQQEALSRQRFDRPVPRKILEAISRREERLDTAGGETAPHER